MTKLLDILLSRNDPNIPWGFSIHGGFDTKVAPFISSVTFGSLAANYLNAGDRVLQIQRQPAGGLLQSEMDRMIEEDGKSLSLLVEKSVYQQRAGSAPPERGKSEDSFFVSSKSFDKLRKDMRARQKRFLRLSETLVDEHFRMMKEFLDESWTPEAITSRYRGRRSLGSRSGNDGEAGGEDTTIAATAARDFSRTP